MKKGLQLFAFLLILVGGFWVGMKWWSATQTPAIDYKPVPTPVTPTPIAPAVTPDPVQTEPTPPVTEAPVTTETVAPTPAPTPAPVVSAPLDLPTPKNDKVNRYTSNYFKYGFDIPANVYYSAFGASDGAQHTVAIAKEIPETLADGAIKVYFYGKKIVPELQNAQNNKYEDPAGKYMYLLLDGQYSVKIEATDLSNPIVQKIVQTISVQ